MAKINSIEEKAKAYDEALARAQEYAIDGYLDAVAVDDIFSALKESEDERIRKSIIGFLITISSLKDGKTVSNKDFDSKAILEWVAWLYKVEPEFKVGDWVMLDRPVLITQVEDMPYNTHQYLTSDDTWFGDATKAKLWTIQDAKDGDVLNSARVKATIIFKGWNPDGKHLDAYCALQKGILIKQEMLWDRDFEPATKEQRDLLFKKMHEAGYEWDAEKKELKKIEKNPVWSEEDEYCINQLITFCGIYMVQDSNAKKYADWLKSLNYRCTWKPTEEQLSALWDSIKHNLQLHPVLKSLYNDLKKLREE